MLGYATNRRHIPNRLIAKNTSFTATSDGSPMRQPATTQAAAETAKNTKPMPTTVSKPAEAFLELEDFFENPPQASEPEESETAMLDEDWYDAHSPDKP